MLLSLLLAASRLPTAEAPSAHEIITSLRQISPATIEALAQALESRGLRTPISQVVGFEQFTAEPAVVVATSETTQSTAYTDLATVGPQLTDLSDGQYLVFFGSRLRTNNTGWNAFMGVKVNSTEADDGSAAISNSGSLLSLMRAIPVTLNAGGNNTLTARYRIGAGTATLTASDRWMIALRYANL